MMTLLFFLIGLTSLIVGAESLVRGASRLAAASSVSPLIIGLTVVAFGTSAPELAVSIKAGLAHQAGIAIGNVVGSNIFNVLFILGASALVAPLVVSQQLVRFDVPLMIGISILTWVFAHDGNISRLEGLLLVLGLIGYVWLLARLSRRESTAVQQEYTEAFAQASSNSRMANAALVLGGLVLLVLGSRWLVDSAVDIAHYLGVSEVVIGLTIVAAGTSLPEVVTSIVASLRGERDIAVGNVIGSNIFNILGVLGMASLVTHGGIDVSASVQRFDIPIMIAVAIACLPIFFSGGKINRWKGALLLTYYVIYTAYLILTATHDGAVPGLFITMLYFAVPLTVVTLLVIVVQELRRRSRR